jgi:hypothetical protein
MPKKALVLVAATVLEARDKPAARTQTNHYAILLSKRLTKSWQE